MILEIVKARFGRRRKITRQEMADLMRALQAAGLDLRNGYVDGTVVLDAKGYDTKEQHPGAARAWANQVMGITCVSLAARGLRDGWVRFDQPGSMNPSQYADLTFVSEEEAKRDHDPVSYLRRHAKRVLIVRSGPELEAEPGETILPKLSAWIRARNTCPEKNLFWEEARHAERLGFLALGGLLRLQHGLNRDPGRLITARELMAKLRTITMYARGEAQTRITELVGERVELPGLVAFAPAHPE